VTTSRLVFTDMFDLSGLRFIPDCQFARTGFVGVEKRDGENRRCSGAWRRLIDLRARLLA
jgi:hypothetical protein